VGLATTLGSALAAVVAPRVTANVVGLGLATTLGSALAAVVAPRVTANVVGLTVAAGVFRIPDVRPIEMAVTLGLVVVVGLVVGVGAILMGVEGYLMGELTFGSKGASTEGAADLGAGDGLSGAGAGPG